MFLKLKVTNSNESQLLHWSKYVVDGQYFVQLYYFFMVSYIF